MLRTEGLNPRSVEISPAQFNRNTCSLVRALVFVLLNNIKSSWRAHPIIMELEEQTVNQVFLGPTVSLNSYTGFSQ